jgi:hypothetical protein
MTSTALPCSDSPLHTDKKEQKTSPEDCLLSKTNETLNLVVSQVHQIPSPVNFPIQSPYSFSTPPVTAQPHLDLGVKNYHAPPLPNPFAHFLLGWGNGGLSSSAMSPYTLPIYTTASRKGKTHPCKSRKLLTTRALPPDPHIPGPAHHASPAALTTASGEAYFMCAMSQ